MEKKISNSQFERIFDHIAPKYNQILNAYAVERRIEFFRKYARGKCLEVGAGTGVISKALLGRHKLVATDISQKMVDEIKRDLKISALRSDAETLPFKNSGFDTVIASETIYYLDNPDAFVKESFRVLKNGGRILISSASKVTEIYDKIRSVLRKIGFKSMYFDDKNRSFMSEWEIRDLLTNNGFKVKATKMAIFIPFRFFDPVNRYLESTLLNRFCSFIYIYGQKA